MGCTSGCGFLIVGNPLLLNNDKEESELSRENGTLRGAGTLLTTGCDGMGGDSCSVLLLDVCRGGLGWLICEVGDKDFVFL